MDATMSPAPFAPAPSGPLADPKTAVRLFLRAVPLPEIEAVLAHTGKTEKRRRSLPAALVVQLVICLCLLRDAASRAVLAYLVGDDETLPSKMAITKARYRLGPRPLMELFARLAKPMATPETVPGAFYAGLRLVALDSTFIDVPDTPANERVFGRALAPRGRTAFPSLRLVTLCECGTHVKLAARVRPYRIAEFAVGCDILERSLAPGMLLLTDRGFTFPRTVDLVASRGAHILGRVTANIALPVLETHPDGSWLSRMGTTAVRAIRYRIEGENISAEFTIATTLLDWRAHPADELAQLYHERWEIETAYDEIKTHQQGRPNGQATLIRAQIPKGVVQEIYAMLVAHTILHTLMIAAAAQKGVDPDRVSFKTTLNIVRAQLARIAKANPQELSPLLSSSSNASAKTSCPNVPRGAASAP